MICWNMLLLTVENTLYRTQNQYRMLQDQTHPGFILPFSP